MPTPTTSEVPTCLHLKADGTFCRANALKGEKYCYFHFRAQAFRTTARQTPAEFAANLPVLDSPANIQAAIDQTAHAVAGGAIDTRTATVLLRAIQLASANLTALDLSQTSCTQPARSAADQRPASAPVTARAQSAPRSAHSAPPNLAVSPKSAPPATASNVAVRPKSVPPAISRSVAVRPKSTPPPSPATPPNAPRTAPVHAFVCQDLRIERPPSLI
jgi:hypothetical protein